MSASNPGQEVTIGHRKKLIMTHRLIRDGSGGGGIIFFIESSSILNRIYFSGSKFFFFENFPIFLDFFKNLF